MTNPQPRQPQILATLKLAHEAISASTLAQTFHVSRQTIVGDIALMRAQGEPIQATPRGYVMMTHQEQRFTLACQHRAEDTEKELTLMIDFGATVQGVIVEHPLYGELRGNLMIKTPTDVTAFVTALNQQKTTLLSSLTHGIHLHTISLKDPKQLGALRSALAAAGFLYDN